MEPALRNLRFEQRFGCGGRGRTRLRLDWLRHGGIDPGSARLLWHRRAQAYVRPGEPDGIAFGSDGNLYVAHHGRYEVVVVSPEGRTIATLPIPGKWVTNLAFRGTDLYVTESHTGTIFRLEVGVSGQTLYCGW